MILKVFFSALPRTTPIPSDAFELSKAKAKLAVILCGLLVRTSVFRANGLRFESGWEPTTRGESCGLPTMSNDRFERTKPLGLVRRWY